MASFGVKRLLPYSGGDFIRFAAVYFAMVRVVIMIGPELAEKDFSIKHSDSCILVRRIEEPANNFTNAVLIIINSTFTYKLFELTNTKIISLWYENIDLNLKAL